MGNAEQVKTPDIQAIMALEAFREQCPGIRKTKTNPHLKNRYADLGAVYKTIAPVLRDNGLVVIQRFHDSGPNTVSIQTILWHTPSGGYIDFGALAIPYEKTTAQAVGSALTYLRRYALSCALGLVTDDDDDGNATYSKNKQSASVVSNAAIDGESAKLRESYEKKIANASTVDALDALKGELGALKSSMTPGDVRALGEAFTSMRGRLTGGELF